MRAFDFTLLAVLSYVAVIGATPLGDRSPAEAIDRRQNPQCFDGPYYMKACLSYCKLNRYKAACADLCSRISALPSCELACEAEPRFPFCKKATKN